MLKKIDSEESSATKPAGIADDKIKTKIIRRYVIPSALFEQKEILVSEAIPEGWKEISND